jgi:hypothetical protein
MTRAAVRFGIALALALSFVLRVAMAAPALVEGSPSWQAVMAVPAERDGEVAFWATDLLAVWGRPDVAARLRRSLLLRHLEAQGAAPPPAATLQQLADAPVPAFDELLAAQQRARQRAGRAAAGAPWAAEAPRDDGAVALLAERVGNRPPADLADFVQRWGGCVPQGRCPDQAAREQARAEAAASNRAARLREELASETRQRASQHRGERRQQAMLAAFVLGGLLLHLLVARYLGRVAANAATVLTGIGLAAWLWLASGPQSGWGALAMLIVVGALACSGLLLAPLYDWIHRRWFARR